VEATSPPVIFFLLPGALVAVFGFALAWRRPLHGFSLLPGRVYSPGVVAVLLFSSVFPVAAASAPLSFAVIVASSHPRQSTV